MSKSPFLKAHWRDLLMANFALEPETLKPFLPVGTEADLWEGKAYVSLVAFYFDETRLKGIRVPGHVHFPEVNLRFYCRQADAQGVGFVSEIVGRPCITLWANRLYNEHYKTRWVRYSTRRKHGSTEHSYFVLSGGRLHSIRALPSNDAYVPATNSLEHFLKERYHGFGQSSTGDLLHYQVSHPIWKVQALKDYDIDVDYGRLFGHYWKFLNTQRPDNVFFAKGSEVEVHHADRWPAETLSRQASQPVPDPTN